MIHLSRCPRKLDHYIGHRTPCLGAIEAGAKDARRGLVGKVRRNFDQPFGQPCIAQLRPAKLLHCPTVHALHSAQRAYTLRHPPLTAGNRARKYGRPPSVCTSRGMMNELCARVCSEGHLDNPWLQPQAFRNSLSYRCVFFLKMMF